MKPFKFLALLTLLIACVQTPEKPQARAFKTLGSLEITLDGTGQDKAKFTRAGLRPQSSNPLPENAFVFTRKFSSSFDIEGNNERYISATFEVKNNSDTAVNNLSLVAYHQAGSSLGGTAIKNLVNFGGSEIGDPSIAQSIFPLQSLKRNGSELVVDSENADFQGFSTNEASSIGDSARTTGAIRNQDTPLEYGFVARNGSLRTIGIGETGIVTLTLRFARPSTSQATPYRFVMTFVMTEDSLTRVTRGLNESTPEAETRAAQLSANEMMLIGYDGDTSSSASMLTNRLENAKIGLEPTYLVTPSLLMRDVQPSSVKNDTDNTVLIRGMKFDANTSFFIQSTKLEVQNLTEREARVIVPKGFLPSKYGIMAANNTGKRATLYPALTIAAGEPPRELDVFDHPNSFIEGYVLDFETKQPIEGARISIAGLETTSTTDGYYFLRGAPAGSHAVKIEKLQQVFNYETGKYELQETHETLFRNALVPTNYQGTITLKLAELERKTLHPQTIDYQGGTVYAQDGAFLKIPVGALKRPVPIQFTHLRAASTLPELSRDGNYLAFAHLSPTGLVFEKPATLYLPLQTGIQITLNTPINILYFNTLQNAWVDDITSGKISRINGRYYLEYEINHFTWIGGTWYDDPLTGCVVDKDGKKLPNITTNRGVTDEFGYFYGTLTQSDVGRTIRAYATLPDGSSTETVSQFYDGNGAVSLPCIVYQTATPSIKPLVAEVLADDQVAPFGAPTPRAADSSPEDCVFSKQQLCTTDDVPILASQKLKVVSYDIKNFKAGQVIAKTIQLFFQNKKVPHSLKAIGNDTMRVFYVLPEPQKANGLQRSVSITFQRKKPDSTLETLERTQSIKSIAQIKTANLAVNVLPNNFVPANIQTPFKTKVPQGVLWIARERDLDENGQVKVYAEVKAYDAYGKVITSITTKNAVYFSDFSTGNNDNTPNRALFINGIAIVPLKITPSNSPRSDQITRVLLNKLYVSSLEPTDNSGTTSRAIGGVRTLTVQPENFSGIYSSEVAAKSPSVGAKSVSFWGQIGSWFTWENVSSTAGQVAQFGLGMIPVLGGAIDCGKGYVNFFTGTEVDLVETEIGCIGMTFDALSGAVALATACGSCPQYAIIKSVLVASRWANRISQSVRGAITRALGKVLRKFTPTTLIALFNDLKELDFLAKFFVTSDTRIVRQVDNSIGDIVAVGCRLTRIKRSIPENCFEDNVIYLVKKVSEGAERAGYPNTDALDAILKTTGSSNGGRYIKGAEKNIIKLDDVPVGSGAEVGAIKGIYFEAKVAADNLEEIGLDVLEMGKDNLRSPPNFGAIDADVYSRVTASNPTKYPTGIDFLLDEVKANVNLVKEDQVLKYIAYAEQQKLLIGEVTGVRYIFEANAPEAAIGVIKKSLCLAAQAAKVWFVARVTSTNSASYVKVNCSVLTEF